MAVRTPVLAIRPVVSDKALALQLCRKECPQSWKVVKEVKYLLRGRGGSTVCVDRHTGRLQRVAESHPHGSMNYFYGVISSGFFWPVILICLVHSLYLVYLRILPCMSTHLLAKMTSTKKADGRISLDITPALTSREPFCRNVVEEVS